MKGKLATKEKPHPTLTKEEADKRMSEQCLKELTEVLNKYNCILEVDFVKEVVLDKQMLLYAINVKKKINVIH